VSDLKNRVHDLLPDLIGDLQALVRIQSVSADPERLGEVEKVRAEDGPAPGR
jgi:acetylornithine deacetylase/succinyl-diaminopimelate desuccinylase-like protein